MEREHKKPKKRLTQEERLEQIGEQPHTIAELLPRYYEAYGDNPRYETVRSMPIAGHDVAWLEYTGHVEYDITGRGQEGKEYSGRELKCECDFTQGIGWDEDENGPHGIIGSNEHCIYKETAQHLRVLELRSEFLDKYKDGLWASRETYGLWEHIPEIMMDMIEKDKAGEFTSEGSGGAHFYGGHYYLQTIHKITNIPYDRLWENVNQMILNKQIQIDGMVVQEYYEPPEPRWEYCGRRRYGLDHDNPIEDSEDGVYEEPNFLISASMPAHSKMPQTWSYDVLDSEGNILSEKLTNLPGSVFMHPLDFGVDVEDSDTAAREMDELAEVIRSNWERIQSGSFSVEYLEEGDASSNTDIE